MSAVLAAIQFAFLALAFFYLYVSKAPGAQTTGWGCLLCSIVVGSASLLA